MQSHALQAPCRCMICPGVQGPHVCTMCCLAHAILILWAGMCMRKATCCPATDWPKQMRWISRAPLLCGAQARHVHAQYLPAASRTYLQMQRGSPIAQRMHMQLQCLLREAIWLHSRVASLCYSEAQLRCVEAQCSHAAQRAPLKDHT